MLVYEIRLPCNQLGAIASSPVYIKYTKLGDYTGLNVQCALHVQSPIVQSVTPNSWYS